MRFPIKTKFVKSKYPRIVADGIVFVNLSDALQESLQDIGIIDPKTHELRQEYFDLPIEEGPVLGCMNEFFDLTGNFHVGCHLDARPASFGFYASKGSSETRKGAFTLDYQRDMKLSVFLGNAFRNTKGVRDLEALARCYNQIEDCKESIGISWSGWTGGISEESRMFSSPKYGFSGLGIDLEFDGQLATRLQGIDSLEEQQSWFSSPHYGKQPPLHKPGKDTKLMEIIQKYHEQKEKLNHHHSQFIYGYNLLALGYSVGDVLFGIMQMGSRIFPTKKDVDANRDRIMQACSTYTPAPEDFDFLRENRLHLQLKT